MTEPWEGKLLTMCCAIGVKIHFTGNRWNLTSVELYNPTQTHLFVWQTLVLMIVLMTR